MDKIKLTENIGVSGKSKKTGDILIIGKDISAEDARYIVSINRAVYIKGKEQPEQPADELESLEHEELLELAKDMGIEKFEKMNKKQLVEAIHKADGEVGKGK